jgi:hypothetical protein
LRIGACKSRGVALEEVDAEFVGPAGTARPQLEMALPEVLVRLSLEHDRMFTY